MRKLILLFLISLCVITSEAQKKYRCEFADSIIWVTPESLFRNLASKTHLSNKAIEQFLEQQRANHDSRYELRIVMAEKDQTIISLYKDSVSGNLTMIKIDSMLYKNDELFNEAPTSSGFSDKPWDRPKRAYRGTGKKLSILDYQCDEFISTDSTVYIWVSTELPEYVNPGVRTGNVKGAVLGFRLTQTSATRKSTLVKLE
jgi:hypothetical protein